MPSRVDEREVVVQFNDVRLYPGSYYVSIWVADGANTMVYDHVADALQFNILDGGKLTARPLPRKHGFLFLTPEWQETKITLQSNEGVPTP